MASSSLSETLIQATAATSIISGEEDFGSSFSSSSTTTSSTSSSRSLPFQSLMDKTLEKYHFEEGQRSRRRRRSRPFQYSSHFTSNGGTTSTADVHVDAGRNSISLPNLKSLIYFKKWEDCITRITNYPQETMTVDVLSQDLPLHEACQSGAPFHVLQHLIHTNPSALSTKGFCGRLPLHYCSYVKPTVNVIKLLLRYYPKAAAVFDDDGRLPLHLAVLRNAPNLVIQTLLDANPMALISLNKFGNTPDMTCQNEYIHSMLEDEKQKKYKDLEDIKRRRHMDKQHHEETTISIGHQDSEDSIVPTTILKNYNPALKDVTVASEYNPININGEGNLKMIPKRKKSDSIPIVPVKGTTYRLISRNRNTMMIRSNIPTPEALIARQYQYLSYSSTTVEEQSRPA